MTKANGRPTAHNPTPFVSHLIRSCPELWDEYIRHPFVVQLGEGTLPRKSFEHYISQDYHYLVHCGFYGAAKLNLLLGLESAAVTSSTHH